MAAGKHILVVEDDDGLRRLLRQSLSLAGYMVTEARGGFEALRQLDHQLPDVIVLDLVMPGVDGFSVAAETAVHARTRHIPIVIVTALAADLRWLNARCVLRKPIAPDEVVRAVDDCLASDVSR